MPNVICAAVIQMSGYVTGIKKDDENFDILKLVAIDGAIILFWIGDLCLLLPPGRSDFVEIGF
jgi:hypothetical protein